MTNTINNIAHSIEVSCDVPRSFRVDQVAGMFDVPLAKKTSEQFHVELPDLNDDWQIGVVVGPSGSGKSTVAREVYGTSLYQPGKWPAGKAVVDCFGEISIKKITAMLTAVGFSSPPSWVKPYRVLSNGEQFRCDLARALLSDRKLIVFDEFTSVVDRTVAYIGSAAIAKALRKGHCGEKRFVAVTCHYDVLDWLTPDWVLDMSRQSLTRGRLRQRPDIHIEVRPGHRRHWSKFAKHHYLNPNISNATTCYYAVYEGQLIGFCGFLTPIGKKGRSRVSRIVTLPDYQGVGIGGAFLAACCELQLAAGRTRISITTSHPGMIGHLRSSPRWQVTSVKNFGSPKSGWKSTPGSGKLNYEAASVGRAVVSAEFIAG